MKVRVSFTVDVDPESWETEYGVSGAAEIREDVKAYIENGTTDHLRGLGLLKEDSNE